MKSSGKTGLIIVGGLIVIVLFAHFMGAGCKNGSPPGASIHLGKTETHSNFSSGSSSCASENDGFNSRRVLLFTDNPHPLNRRIAMLLAEKLKDCQFIGQLEVTNQPFTFTDGTGLPDLFVNVNLIELKEEGLFSHSLKAVVTASLGNALWQSSRYSQDSSSPPLVAFFWNGTHESETTFTGVRTDRYGDTARSIADDLAKAISKKIEELSDKYPALPELGREFYGSYQPVAEFDFMKEVQARRMASGFGLLTHNETFWQFRTATNPVPQLKRIISQLETAGWKLSDASLTNTESYSVLCHRNGAELEIFRQRTDRMDLWRTGQKESFCDFVVHYRQPFNQAEREAAVEKLFTEPRPAEELLPFQNLFSSAQRKKFYELAEKSPGTSPRACIQLANIYLDRKRTNDAINMLTRAKALAAIVKDAAPLESSIDTLTKKISPKKSLKLEVTPETCHELGFLEFTNAMQTIEQERRLGEPLIWFEKTNRGVKIYGLTVSPPQKNAYPWLLVQTEDGSRSSSWSNFTLNSRGGWEQSFTFNEQTLKITVVPQPEAKRVKFSIRAGQ